MNPSPDPAWLYYTRIEKQGVVVGVVGHCSECGVKKELRVAFWGDGDRANRYLREQWFDKHTCIPPQQKRQATIRGVPDVSPVSKVPEPWSTAGRIQQ